MGQFALPILFASTAITAGLQVRSGNAQKAELKVAQKQEGSAARDREVQRRRRLAAILGAQSATAAASGVQMSGSVANISLTDLRRASEDSLVDSSNTRLRIDALSRRRTSISELSSMRAATTIFGAVDSYAARGTGTGAPADGGSP